VIVVGLRYEGKTKGWPKIIEKEAADRWVLAN